MKFRVNRSKLLTELLPMQGIVERRTTIPVLAHLLLNVKGDQLRLAATDLDVSLTSWTDAEVVSEGAIAVQARKFMEIVRSLVGEDVDLALEDEKRLLISAGPSRFKINGLSADDFPTLPEVSEDNKVELPFTELKAMIGKVIFAVSTEESRFQLNGALLQMKSGALEMVATDGHRLALVENASSIDESSEGVLVPRKALQELLRFDDEGNVVFLRGEHHLCFKLGRRELICRILEGTFPDYERVISKANDQKAVFERKALYEAVQRVALLTGDRARAVRFSFASNQLTISAANPDLGEAVEEVVCEYGGEELRLGVNPDYMSQFLAAVGTEKVRLELKDENTQCIGYPVDGEDQRYLCVIMPMRI
ncbi:MAG: DNA polymerase III subunit beta [Acidobacteriota bacterium]|nr:DNA polymerase III subunit beta [Acidobacteriota bacterium]